MIESSSLTPFEPGDILVGATLLNDPDDDHAGTGRIIQYDRNLKEKGELRMAGRSHLIGGLRFDPEGRLWAFDSQEFRIFVFDQSAQPVSIPEFDARPFSNVNFFSNGDILLGEHVVGSEITVELGTTIPKMPGTDRYGDGHMFRYSAAGELTKEYATETHGGMGGFLGVTMSALAPDEKSVVYASETGPRLMRYDLDNDRQLPDLISYPEGQREMFFAMAYDNEGRLMVTRGDRIDVVDNAGQVVRSYPLEGFGWAMICPCADASAVLTTNFFNGEVAKVSLADGSMIAQANTGVARSVAGVAEYRG